MYCWGRGFSGLDNVKTASMPVYAINNVHPTNLAANSQTTAEVRITPPRRTHGQCLGVQKDDGSGVCLFVCPHTGRYVSKDTGLTHERVLGKVDPY